MHLKLTNLRNFTKTISVSHFIMAMFFLLTGFSLHARNYYVSSSTGNDGYSSTQAQNQATPWKSLSKVNSIFNIIVGGDSILFKRGDVFYGSLVVNASGNSAARIILGAYGSGAKPLFSGFTKTSGWTSNGNGIWQCAIPAAKTNLNLITVDGTNQAVGRYPNIDATNGGYLNYENITGFALTDNELPASPNWAGADVVIRKTRWILDICKINSQVGNTLNFTNPATVNFYSGLKNFGYFIQNDPKTLDKFGEWYFNKQNKTLQMFFGATSPSGYTVNISSIDTILNLTGDNYITIDNIALEGGNVYGIYAINNNAVTIQNCDLNNSGDFGFYLWNLQNLVVENNSLTNVLSYGMYINNKVVTTPTTIRNNTIKNVGTLAGMGESGDNTYIGLGILGDNFLLEYNTIDGTGYNALQFHGNNVVVKNNFVNNFCSVKDDGGGIYTWADDGVTQYVNRTVTGNIITGAIGAGYGTQRPNDSQDARGIYLDGGAMNMDITDNTVANCVGSGFYFNNIVNIKALRNTVYNAKNSLSLQRYDLGPLLRNNVVKNNIFFPLYPTQNDIFYWNSKLNVPVVTDIQTDMRQVAVFDSNYYRNDMPAPFDYFYHLTFAGVFVDPPPLNFSQWQSFMNQDAHSSLMPRDIPKYKINKTISANTVQNGKFEANISGVTSGSSNNNAVVSWDNTSKITGTGTLKITPKSLANVYTAFYAPVGAVTAGKSYILKVATRGTTINGYMSATLRQIGSPYGNIAPTQNRFFGTAIQTNEFLISPTITDANAGYLIGIQQSAGTTYIDNIEFYEVDASMIDVTTQVRFEYNPTKQNKTINLDSNYIGVDGTSYSGSITLAPYTSKVLLYDTSTVVQSSMIAGATAPNISCFGGTTVATIAARGGKAPYTGTGTSLVSAGKGSLKLAFNTSIPNSFELNYWPIGAVTNDKSYVLRFSTLGTTSNGIVTATIRQTESPFATLTPTQQHSFGTNRIDHEFIFTNPTAFADASFLIGIDQGSGTTYIDNIAFFELDANGGAITGSNLYTGGDFESDINGIYTYSSNNNHLASWDTTGKISRTYYFTVKDSNKDSAIAILNTVQPSAPLTSTISAGTITIPGGTTTVTVTATGGTAPYTGTGSFTVKAGNYSYTVIDAKGCSTSQTITVNPAVAIPTSLTAIASVPAISCFGGNTTAVVSGSGGTAPYTGTGSYTVNAGTGSLKISVVNPVAGSKTLLYSSVGPVSNSKSYVLRFSTLATFANGSLVAAIRQTNSPWANITAVQTRTFGTSRVDHEFLFNAPPTEAAASFIIGLVQASGTVYIDNIAFFEATSTGAIISDNLYDGGQFEDGNISGITAWSANKNHVAELDVTSKISNTYYFPIHDSTGAISTATVITTQPDSALQASASAANVTVTGGTSTVVIAATGGTAPYTGTGSFANVKVGTYNYTVTDANGCSVITSVTVNLVLSPVTVLTADAIVPAINCFGGNATATVTAAGGTAPYTGTGSYIVNAGKGTLKISANNPSTTAKTLLYSFIGSVSNTKSYILRFSTLGTIANGSLVAAIRRTNPAWENITPTQSRTYGTTRVDHEFLFTAPVTEPSASFVIALVQTTGITYIDNIAFFEATPTGEIISDNLYASGQFESSISGISIWSAPNNHVASLDLTSKISNTYYYPITDAKGAISTATVPTSQPASALQATSTAGNILLAGGLTTVLVSATGGTPPYIGTGNILNVGVGTYTYTVTDAKGCVATTTISVIQNILARSATTSAGSITSQPLTSNTPSLDNNPLKINTYPNPNVSEFNLMVEGGTRDKVNIVVQSIDGKVLYQARGNSNSKYTFGDSFVAGVYIVKVTQGNNTRILKIVKAKL